MNAGDDPARDAISVVSVVVSLWRYAQKTPYTAYVTKWVIRLIMPLLKDVTSWTDSTHLWERLSTGRSNVHIRHTL